MTQFICVEKCFYHNQLYEVDDLLNSKASEIPHFEPVAGTDAETETGVLNQPKAKKSTKSTLKSADKSIL